MPDPIRPIAELPARNFRLKNGVEVFLRGPQPGDVVAFRRFLDAVLTDGTGMTALPGEIEFRDDHFQSFINSHQRFSILAWSGDQVVGTADFSAGKRKRTAHTGTFGISVHPGWRNLGLGSILIDGTIEHVRRMPSIEKIKLNVIAGNEPAIALYKSRGFVEESRMEKEIKFADGTYADDIRMCLFIGE